MSSFIDPLIRDAEAELERPEHDRRVAAEVLLILYRAAGKDSRTRAVRRVQATLQAGTQDNQRASGRVRQGTASTRARSATRRRKKSPRAKKS